VSSYYLSREGRQLGPFSEHELRAMLSSGQTSPHDLACVVGDTQWQPVHSLLGLTTMPGASGESAVSTIVPYKNPPALIGYYLGVFSLIPCLGLFLGIAAIILGVIGLKKAAGAPDSKGKMHAWTAIVLGSIGIVVSGAIVVVPFIFGANQR
jgi:hypothetical protein